MIADRAPKLITNSIELLILLNVSRFKYKTVVLVILSIIFRILSTFIPPETAGKIYSSKFTAWALGFPCSIGLMVLAVCNCVEEPTLHYIGAFAYFVCFAIWCVVCSFKELSVSCSIWYTERHL